MLWVRLHTEVKERLGPRLLEWEHALILMLFGLILAQPRVSMGSIPNEDTWGTVIFSLGLLRLLSLVVNGLRRKMTSWLRAFCSISSSMVFVLIGLGYVISGNWGVAAAFFPIVAVFELFNYSRAMRDVGSAS
jgi:hypothetical protein